MKQIIKFSATVFSLILLMNCTAQMPKYEELHRQWMLLEFKNFSKETLVKNKANLDLSATKSPKNQYNAYMGCNRMFMNAEFKPGGKVEFSKIGSTMMYCDKAMDLETEFGKILPTMTKYKIEGHFLTLSNKNGEKMKFVAADWD